VIKISLASPLMHRERHGNEQKKNEGCKACHFMPQRLNLSYVKAMGKGLGMKDKGCEERTMQARRAQVQRRRRTKPNIMTFQDYKTQLEH
jgi:hypothetical protein